MADITFSNPNDDTFSAVRYTHNGVTTDLNELIVVDGTKKYYWHKKFTYKLTSSGTGVTSISPSSGDVYYNNTISLYPTSLSSNTPSISLGSNTISVSTTKISSDSSEYGYYRYNYYWNSYSEDSIVTKNFTANLHGQKDARVYKVIVDGGKGGVVYSSSGFTGSSTEVSVSSQSASTTLYGTVVGGVFMRITCGSSYVMLAHAQSSTYPFNAYMMDFSQSISIGEGTLTANQTALGAFKNTSDYISITMPSKISWTTKYNGNNVTLGDRYSQTSYTTTYNFSDYTALSGVTLDTSKPIYVYMGTSATLSRTQGYFYATSNGENSGYISSNDGYIKITSFTSNSLTVYHSHSAGSALYRKVIISEIYQP